MFRQQTATFREYINDTGRKSCVYSRQLLPEIRVGLKILCH